MKDGRCRIFFSFSFVFFFSPRALRLRLLRANLSPRSRSVSLAMPICSNCILRKQMKSDASPVKEFALFFSRKCQKGLPQTSRPAVLYPMCPKEKKKKKEKERRMWDTHPQPLQRVELLRLCWMDVVEFCLCLCCLAFSFYWLFWTGLVLSPGSLHCFVVKPIAAHCNSVKLSFLECVIPFINIKKGVFSFRRSPLVLSYFDVYWCKIWF